MSLTNCRTKFSFLFLFFALAFVAASAHDPSASAPTLEEAPPGASPPSSASSDGGSISAPAGGSDAKSILADQSHMMGTMSDSTDDNSSGQKPGEKSGPMQHGQCVTSCATKSTDNAGCGKDLSKPDCFCKSQDFIQGTFACVNATCPAQYHGAAGVITVSTTRSPFASVILFGRHTDKKLFVWLGMIEHLRSLRSPRITDPRLRWIGQPREHAHCQQ